MENRAKRKIRDSRLVILIRRFVYWYLDLINPKRIVRYYVHDVKNNRLSYALAIIIFIGIISVRMGSMDFGTGTMFGVSLYGAICGGAVDTSMSADLLTFAKTIYNTIRPVGVALVVLFWLTELVSITVRDSFSTEILAMHFAKIIIGVFLMFNGENIITELVNLEAGLRGNVDTAAQNALNLSATQEVTGNEVADAVIKIVDFLRILPVMSLLLLMAGISCIVLKLQCISRSIKMALLFAFAPIGLADLAGNEHSTSIRYLKHILALSIQGALLVGINYLAAFLMLNCGELVPDSDSALQNIWTVAKGASFSLWAFIPILAVGFAAIGMYSKSEEIARTIVGI